MNPERVCIFVSSLEVKNGIARVVSEISWHLKNKAVIFTSKYKPDSTHQIPKTTKILKIKPDLYNGFIGWFLFLQADGWRIIRFIRKKEKISTLNPHGLHTIILASLIKIIFLKRKLKNSAFIYDREEFTLPPDSSWLKKIQHRIDLLLIKILLKLGFIDEILVLDNTVARLVRRFLNTDKVKIIRIGVSHSMIKLAKRKNWPPSEKIKKAIGKKAEIKLFFQAVLIPRRRVEDLLEGLHLLKQNNKTNISLYIGGSLHYDTQYTNFIYKTVNNLGLSKYVHFLGTLSEEELACMYQMCAVFIFPNDKQTWGLAPLEAMIFKKPVIVSTGCGVSEILNEDIAVLVPPREPVFIKEALDLLIRDKDRRKKLGRNGHDYVLRNFTFANTIADLKKLWKIHD